MKKAFLLIVAVMLTAGLNAQAGSSGQKKRVASDDALMQSANSKMPTRVIKNGTRIIMRFGSTVIPGTLNDSETAKALIARLPYTVRVSRYSHDFCGVMDDSLPYSERSVHFGWLNGDIDFARDANTSLSCSRMKRIRSSTGIRSTSALLTASCLGLAACGVVMTLSSS